MSAFNGTKKPGLIDPATLVGTEIIEIFQDGKGKRTTPNAIAALPGSGGLTGLTATVDELNHLDGITSDVNELNILDGVTSDAGELNILDGVTATYAELNALDGIQATVEELNSVRDLWWTVTPTWVDGTDGTGTMELQFLKRDGVTALTAPVCGKLWIADAATGLGMSTITSLTGTTGEIEIANTAVPTYYNFITTGTGQLNFTLVAGAAMRYLAISHWGGVIKSGGPCEITGP